MGGVFPTLPVRLAGIVLILALLPGCSKNDTSGRDDAVTSAENSNDPVVVYSSRAEHLIKPMFDRYQEVSGQKIVYTTDKEQPLIQKLLAEGESTQADILLTVDAGNLWYAAEKDVLRPLDSEVLRKTVPPFLRDPDNRWFALSMRARSIVYHEDRVDSANLRDYASLADKQWRGRLCLRTSKKVYNQSLVSMLIAQHGESATEKIVSGWVANLATDVFSSDTKLLEAMMAGQCDVGVVNTYYLGRLQKDGGESQKLKFFWPDKATGGVHVNISGAGITRHAKRPAAARALLEWLVSSEAQALFSSVNLEYPIGASVSPDPIVNAWGAFSPSEMNIAAAGELQPAAVRLMDRAGYH